VTFVVVMVVTRRLRVLLLNSTVACGCKRYLVAVTISRTLMFEGEVKPLADRQREMRRREQDQQQWRDWESAPSRPPPRWRMYSEGLIAVSPVHGGKLA
jgi:hypothetical protein